MESIDDARFRCFLSNSNRNLFEVTKAISKPEKNAENSNVSNMNGIVLIILNLTIINSFSFLQRYNFLVSISYLIVNINRQG